MNEKSALIEAEKATYPVAWMCRLLGVARSSLYAWRTAAKAVTATAARRARYTELVRKEFTRQRGRAGCRTITAVLNSRGHPCSVGFVAAIMRANNLVAVQPRPDKRTTVPGGGPHAGHGPHLGGLHPWWCAGDPAGRRHHLATNR